MLLALCSPLASAQEAEVRAEKARVEVDSVEGGVSSIEVMDTDEPVVEGPGVDEDRQERGAGERRSRRFRQGMSSNEMGDGQPGWRPGARSSPEALRIRREIMEKENISPQDLRGNPELRRELREKVEPALREREGDAQSVGDSAERQQRRRRGPTQADPAGEGLRRYMDAVVENNLFLPLGSGGEERKTAFALTAVISNTSNGSDSKAIIEKRGGGEGYYVSEGDTFADEIEVVDIDEEIVKLDRSGEEEELKLGEGTQSGRGGGRRGGRRPGAEGERRPGDERERPEGDFNRGGESGDFDPDRIPPPIRRILEERGISIDELRGNPELREELRKEFEERFRRGGSTQEFSMETRPLDGDRRPPDRVRRMRR